MAEEEGPDLREWRRLSSLRDSEQESQAQRWGRYYLYLRQLLSILLHSPGSVSLSIFEGFCP